MRIIEIIAFIFLLLIASLSCDSTEPPAGSSAKLTLAVEDSSCTEVWLKLTTTNIPLPVTLSLEQNNIVSQTISLCCKDTLLYIDSLLPKQTYKFKAVLTDYQQPTTNEVTVQTMDTTSHNFSWQSWEFGIPTGNQLYDVDIIDEDNIWAVGEIYTADSYTWDSLGNWIDPYNALLWNGTEWELKRIYYIYNGSSLWSPIRTIFAFNENDIWFGANLHWNGIGFEQPNYSGLSGWEAYKIWGTSSEDLYVVGNEGNIAHYSGPSGGWQKIESGTDLPLLDIFENDDGITYISGSDYFDSRGILLSIDQTNNVETVVESEIVSEYQLFRPKLYGELATVWIDDHNSIYTGGNLIFRQKIGVWDYLRSLPENYIGGNPNVYYRGFVNRIRGKSSNDFWIVGERNTLRHFNGVSWVQVGLPYDPASPITWKSIDIKENLVVVVGNNGLHGIIMMIKR